MPREPLTTGNLEVNPQSSQWVRAPDRDGLYGRRTGTVDMGGEVYGVRVVEQPSYAGPDSYRVEYAPVSDTDTVVDPAYFDADESAVREFSDLPGIGEAFRSVWEEAREETRAETPAPVAT